MIGIALTYGLIAGLVTISSIIASMVFASTQGSSGSEWLGYLIMILALSLIFFGVKRRRDRDLGGVIRFMPAFLAGLTITLVASLIYVAVWEIYLAMTDFSFITNYTAALIEEKNSAGLSAENLERELETIRAMASQYTNPLFRLPITFSEIFPVGLIIALISAAILRNPRALPARI